MDIKKYNIIFGSKEKPQPNRIIREKEELILAKNIVKTVSDENDDTERKV